MTRRWHCAPLLAVTLLFVLAAPVLGAPNRLSNPVVSPTNGTPATTFTFTVHYEGFAATVTASVAGRTVQMGVISGTNTNGTFGGTSTLPVGTWPVTFTAVAERNDDTIAGPTVTVTSGATPRPTVAPTTAPPTPVPTPAPPPITATPLQATPLPSSTASPGGSGSPGASGFIGGFIRTPAPTSTPEAAAPAVEPPAVGDEMWTLVTGGLIALSALALLAMVGILRTRRGEGIGQPIGPADTGPPRTDE